MRGETGRAMPTVHTVRASKGSGWQNGTWLLIARINLLIGLQKPKEAPGAAPARPANVVRAQGGAEPVVPVLPLASSLLVRQQVYCAGWGSEEGYPVPAALPIAVRRGCP